MLKTAYGISKLENEMVLQWIAMKTTRSMIIGKTINPSDLSVPNLGISTIKMVQLRNGTSIPVNGHIARKRSKMSFGLMPTIRWIAWPPHFTRKKMGRPLKGLSSIKNTSPSEKRHPFPLDTRSTVPAGFFSDPHLHPLFLFFWVGFFLTRPVTHPDQGDCGLSNICVSSAHRLKHGPFRQRRTRKSSVPYRGQLI